MIIKFKKWKIICFFSVILLIIFLVFLNSFRVPLEEKIKNNIEKLGSSYPIKTHFKAFDTLYKIGKPAVPLLIETFKEDKDTVRRKHCLRLLCHIVEDANRKVAINVAKNSLENDPYSEIRSTAADMLGYLKDEFSLPLLVKVAKTDECLVRASVAGALGNIGGEVARKTLEEMLKDPEPIVQQCAIRGISELKADKNTISIIEKVLYQEEYSFEVKEEAREALKRMKHEER